MPNKTLKAVNDPFGMNFQDSTDEDGDQVSGNIGPKDSLPPNYIRDSTTGKFTGEILTEVSEEDKKMVNLGPIAKERRLTERFEATISRNGGFQENPGISQSMADVARRQAIV